MAVSTRYRWIAVGSIIIRNHANAPDAAVHFSIDEVIDCINARVASENMYRIYSSASRIMWCDDVDEDGQYYHILLHAADKNVAGMSLVDFQTLRARDIVKAEEEGGLYSSHILIRKSPDRDGRHLVLVEKVPGAYLKSFKDHLSWVCNSPSFMKAALGTDGRSKSYRAVFEVDGYQSRTISDALSGGVLKDVEFVTVNQENIDGLDEDEIVEEVINEAKWTVNKRVAPEQAQRFFRGLRHRKPANNSKMFVRIKTENGQIKSTEIDLDNDSILEQAFIQNEVVTGFESPLTSRHQELRADVITKMRSVAPSDGG